tara:strand:+ start:455 stop:739 length:285 start_codon:yes stop_codon:yes gene_type:complete
MNNILYLIFVLSFLSGCNKHSNVTQLRPTNISNYVYQDKPFELKWKIEKNSITKIPAEVNKKIKNICKNHNRFVLIKIKTFKDDTALGAFDCRI